MIVYPGECVHVMTRPLFERDVRRHFVGEVLAANEIAARVQGYVFVYEPERGQFVRRPELRLRVIGFGDGLQIIKIIPQDVELERLVYRIDAEGRLVVTDGRGFSLDIHEFLPPPPSVPAA